MESRSGLYCFLRLCLNLGFVDFLAFDRITEKGIPCFTLLNQQHNMLPIDSPNLFCMLILGLNTVEHQQPQCFEFRDFRSIRVWKISI